MERSSRGVVYLTWGAKYVEEARRSASSVAQKSGEPCVLFTDIADLGTAPFENIVQLHLQHSYKDKIRMRKSPFERTLFLDSDTLVINSMSGIFELLDRFDVVVAIGRAGLHYEIPNVPMEAFLEPSAGAIAWRKNLRTEAFFDLWEAEYDAIEQELGKGAWDQRSLRAALWKSDVSIMALPDSFQMYSFDIGLACGSVKMVHGRGDYAENLSESVNKSLEYRVHLPRLGVYPAHYVPAFSYLRLSAAAFRMFAVRGVRRVLHYARIMRFPENTRPM